MRFLSFIAVIPTHYLKGVFGFLRLEWDSLHGFDRLKGRALCLDVSDFVLTYTAAADLNWVLIQNFVQVSQKWKLLVEETLESSSY